MTLIGICGRARSGKDTTYQAIRKLLGSKARRFAFADELKWEVARACGVTPEHIEANKEKFRPVLQWWAEWRREQDPDYWVKRLDKSLKHYLASMPSFAADALVICVTDMRYPNEAAWVESFPDWATIRVYRPVSGPLEVTDGHISEHALKDYCALHEIDNDGTPEQLEQEVAYALAEMGLLSESEVAK
jgi:hypothetical protein